MGVLKNSSPCLMKLAGQVREGSEATGQTSSEVERGELDVVLCELVEQRGEGGHDQPEGDGVQGEGHQDGGPSHR